MFTQYEQTRWVLLARKPCFTATATNCRGAVFSVQTRSYVQNNTDVLRAHLPLLIPRLARLADVRPGQE